MTPGKLNRRLERYLNAARRHSTFVLHYKECKAPSWVVLRSPRTVLAHWNCGRSPI